MISDAHRGRGRETTSEIHDSGREAAKWWVAMVIGEVSAMWTRYWWTIFRVNLITRQSLVQFITCD